MSVPLLVYRQPVMFRASARMFQRGRMALRTRGGIHQLGFTSMYSVVSRTHRQIVPGGEHSLLTMRPPRQCDGFPSTPVFLKRLNMRPFDVRHALRRACLAGNIYADSASDVRFNVDVKRGGFSSVGGFSFAKQVGGPPAQTSRGLYLYVDKDARVIFLVVGQSLKWNRPPSTSTRFGSDPWAFPAQLSRHLSVDLDRRFLHL